MRGFIFAIIKIIVVVVFILVIIACVQGCAGTGFEKQTTLMPDSVNISFSQARYREEDAAYRGFMVGFQWKLK